MKREPAGRRKRPNRPRCIAAIQVVLRLQAGPGTVAEIAGDLDVGDDSVRHAIYLLRDLGNARAAGYRGVAGFGKRRAVVWEFQAKDARDPVAVRLAAADAARALRAILTRTESGAVEALGKLERALG